MNLPIQRLSIGLALPGDHVEPDPDAGHDVCLVFHSTYPRKRDAEAAAQSITGCSVGYLSGRFERGWSVLGKLRKPDVERFRQGYPVNWLPWNWKPAITQPELIAA